tara:strand:+ start:180 stop:392 length:213 start_codon:yes stop_codon:yes gene_type:complete
MYFKKIEKELNKTITLIGNNLNSAIKNEEWEAVILSCGAIMDIVKSTQPQAFGALAKVMSGKDDSVEFFQ